MDEQDADVIVIGSGFGGSVAAARLVDAGKKVILLERGPWRDTVATRGAGIPGRIPLPRDGGMFGILRSLRLSKGPKRITLNKTGYLEMWIGDGLKVPVTSNVGGGSHIWAAMLEQPKTGYWDNRAKGVSDAKMASQYTRLKNELCAAQPKDPTTIPNHTDHAWKNESYLTALDTGEQPPMGILYSQGSKAIITTSNGVQRESIDTSEDNGMYGSPGASKSTVDALFLLTALKKGLDVRALHEVSGIEKTENGFTVLVRDFSNKRSIALKAAQVVMAAGTMNTNAILLASVDAGTLPKMPSLGLGLGANGDLIGKWPSDGRDARLGTPVAGRIKIAGHEDGAYVIVATGEAPPVPRFLRSIAQKKAGQAFDVIAMSQDASNGRIWSDKGRIRFEFDMKASPTYTKTMLAFDALGKASGRVVSYPGKEVFSAHPCGGCRISDDPMHGVVDGLGQAHGCSGLYVADASVFPQSLGVPPSLSIAAWSSHVAENMINNT